jgi:pimeloyl-ACP methyl ester carboxylesterase
MPSATAYITSDRTVKLRDGRLLGFAEFGDPAGKPIFYFHGYPGSRVEASISNETASKMGVRLIGIDRPGMGLSTFKPGRRMLDFPDDVVELANALEIDRFAVMGISGGGPYVTTCAYKIPERLTAAGIVCGMGPMELGLDGMMPANKVLFSTAQRTPWLFGPLIWAAIGRVARNETAANKAFSAQIKRLPEADQKAMRNPQNFDGLLSSTLQAFQQGSTGPIHDGKLYAQSWGFRLEDVSMPNIYLWHGEKDINVGVAMARRVAAKLPHCQATFYPDEAHISLPINRAEEIFKALLTEK